MTLRIHTARLAYRGPDRLDITRAGADAARRKGEPFPGEPWAPSWGILRPALDARRRTQELARFAESALADHFDGDDPSDHASEEAAEIEAEAWAAYVPAYTAEMRVSYGIAPERMGDLERAAVARGARAHRAAWDALLAREEVTLCCYCSAPPGGVLQCHRILCALMLVKCGAVYEGER